MKIATIGQKQVGKSTMAGVMARALGGTFVDTSEAIYDRLAEELGTTVGELRKVPKEELRPKLIEVGDRISKGDPLAIVRPALTDGNVAIAGIRKPDQLKLLREEFPDTVVIWINRPGHDPGGVDNLELTESDADLTFTNDKSLRAFRDGSRKLLANVMAMGRKEPTTEEPKPESPFLMVRAILHGQYDPYPEVTAAPAVAYAVPSLSEKLAAVASAAREGDVIVSTDAPAALALAMVCGDGVEVVCADPCLGGHGFWTPQRRSISSTNMGRSTWYEEFIGSVIMLGLQGKVTPFPAAPEVVSAWLQNAGIKPVLVYVGGDYGPDDGDVAMLNLQLWVNTSPTAIAGNAMEVTPTRNAVNKMVPGRVVEDDGSWWAINGSIAPKVPEA